jgi:hypothetical protein
MSQNLLDHALAYAARGWRVFSLSGYKIPFKGSHGHLDATTDPETIRAMWAKRPTANIGLAPGQDLVIVDPDGPNALAQLAEMAAPHGGMPITLTARTPRGGLHLYYRAPAGVVLKCWAMPRAHKGDDGIDIKTAGGYVLLPPSTNAKTGGRYEWLNTGPIAELPLWFAEWVLAEAGRPRERKAKIDAARPSWLPVLPAARRITEGAAIIEMPPIEDVDAALAVIPNPDLGWDAFKNIGMAVWAATQGQGFTSFDRWAQKSRKRDLAESEKAWREICASPPTEIGYGSLVFYAREAQPGWTAPSEQPQDSAPPEMDEAPAKSPPDPADAGQAQEKQGVNGFHFAGEQTAKPKSNNPLIELNKKYSVIGDVGGKCLVLSWVPSKIDRSLKVPSFQSFKSFAERYGNRYVKIGDEHKPLGSHWLRWPGRESYEGIDLVPNGPKVLENGALNLWGGFAVEASPASAGWGLMRRHICEVLAGGDVAAAEYITKFAAWTVQHPGERAEVALVFRGGKGSGKGTFANALVRIFGAHGLQVFNSKHLVGAFNGHLRNCLLLFADEAFWAGDKQGESVLKGMLTERALVIEQKGVDAVLWENRLHVIMAANAEWVVPASHDERRFAMFDVSNARVGDRGYFDALHAELMSGGLGAMLFDLLRVELGDWHPRQIVKTEALRSQKERSLDPLHEWWEEILQNGRLPLIGDSDLIAAGDLVHIFQEMSPKARNQVSSTAIGRFLRALGCERIHRRDGNFWQIKPINEQRAIWEAKFGTWEWRADFVKWREPVNHSPTIHR